LAPLAGEGEGEAVLAPAPVVAPASTPQ
jgi:hypothetical protein